MDAAIRSRSITLAVLIHAAIILILVLVVMTTPIPPFAEAGGSSGALISIGFEEAASGDVQPMSEQVTAEPVKVKPAPQPEEKVATQDFEKSPVFHEKKETAKAPKKTEVKPVETKRVEPVRTVNQNAIYKGATTSSTSQGTKTGTGDEGARNGDPNSVYSGNMGSGGKGGTGDGGDGDHGPGGNGKGGISYALGSRKMLVKPALSDHSQETGRVVVAITVDKGGHVIAAVPGYRGSTTTSSHLFEISKDAAMKARFDASPDGADIQKGTITFVFVVQ